MDEKKTKLLLAVVDFLESSSSDSEYENIDALFKCTKPAKLEELPNIIEQYNDDQFKDIYKMNRNTVQYLVNEFSESKYYPGEANHGGFLPSSPENHILSFVWFASHKCGIKTVAQEFKIGISTCFHQIIRVMNFLVSIATKWIEFPHVLKDIKDTANEFKKISDFPGTIGCIGTMVLKTRAPVEKQKHKKYKRKPSSVMLQAICGYNHKITNVFIGPNENKCSSDIFELSPISKNLPKICDKDFHILGNFEYHLREFLLTPFDTSDILTDDQENFNNRLLATNLLINNTFALLRGRFKQLEYVYFHKSEKVSKFILACCVLHNICIDSNDFLEIIDIAEDTFCHKMIRADTELFSRNVADMKRNTLCVFLNYQ